MPIADELIMQDYYALDYIYEESPYCSSDYDCGSDYAFCDDYECELTPFGEEVYEEVKAYAEEYVAMKSWVNSRVVSCNVNDGINYQLFEYRCEGFMTEMIRRSEYPELDVTMGCCIGGYGVKSLDAPVQWDRSETPDFLKTQVPIGEFPENYPISFSKNCAQLTDYDGFIYDPDYYVCETPVGDREYSTGYGCCIFVEVASGNGLCDVEESCETCPTDCGECEQPSQCTLNSDCPYLLQGDVGEYICQNNQCIYVPSVKPPIFGGGEEDMNLWYVLISVSVAIGVGILVFRFK
jgi:hypothetical protein